MDVVISRGIFLLLLYLQNIHGQQGVNNNGKLNGGCLSQQIGQKPCPMQNSGYPQQSNGIQSMPQSVQSFNIPLSTQTGNYQTQSNQDSQGKINQLSDIFSALHNIRLYQTSNSNPSIKSGPASKGTEQPSFIITKPNVNQVTSQTDSTKSQPSFTFQFVPVSSQNGQQNSQYYLAPAQSQPSSQQANYYNQPTNVASPQASPVQSSGVIPVSSSQVNPVQSQPIVFALQSPQYSETPVLFSSPQTPVMLNVPPQQSSVSANQANSKLQIPVDGKSIMSMLMSQFQNPQSSSNTMPAMIPPGYLNSKQEKPSGMKALLPLIFNMLNERRSCCNQCGCPCANQQPTPVQEPTVYSGYSTQKDYSQNLIQKEEKKPADVKEAKVEKVKNNKKTKVNVSEEASEEYEDYEEDEEEVNEE